MQSTTWMHNVLFCLFLADLHITAQIVWQTKPQHTAVVLGQDLVLNCHAFHTEQSTNQLSYTWQFNQTAVQSKALLMANSSLFVPNITWEDVGEYTCRVRNLYADRQTVEVETPVSAEEIKASAHVLVAYIKDFLIHPSNITATVGSEVVLTCVTGRSVPHPLVYWERNGVAMTSANAVTASFGEFDTTGLSDQISMKLTYKVIDSQLQSFHCVAENPLSGVKVRSLPAVLTPKVVDFAPQILSSFPPQMVVAEFEQVRLDCVVIGYPAPSIFWLNDSNYVDDARVLILANNTLIIPRVTAGDTRNYSCIARNRAGRASSNFTSVIVVSLGLQFESEPSDVTVLAGSSVTLHCTPPRSLPPASVWWYKDYVPFVQRQGGFSAVVTQNGTARNLHFSSVQESDEGDYYCVASNNFSHPTSRTSAVARLTVQGAPVITEPPVNTIVVKGSLLQLVCRVDLNNVRSVFWIFNGQRLQSSASVSLVNHGQVLLVNNVGKSWEGLYTCTAENFYGQKTASAEVTVVVPPVTLQELGSRTVRSGDAVLLPCFIYSDPEPFLAWYHDGSLVAEDNRLRLLITGLFIDPVNVDDRGTYSCRGSNSGGFTWNNGTMDVTVPPTVDLEGDKIMAGVVGETLTLKCVVHGRPQPSVHWLHNGTSKLDSLVEFSHDNASLTVPVFTWSWSGEYSCVATNAEDSAVVTVFVSTQVKPKVLEIAGTTAVAVGHSVHLTCVAEGIPKPQVTWKHQEKTVNASLDGRISFPNPSSLLVMFAVRTDQGLYECAATSVIGNSSHKVRVVIIEHPLPPQLLEAKTLSVNSVLLKWQNVLQAPRTSVDSLVIHYRKRILGTVVDYPKKLSPLTTEMEVDGLEAGTEYVFSISAENLAGQGAASNILTAVTYQSGPAAPQNLRLTWTTATSAGVAWERPSYTQGNIEEYQLQLRKGGEINSSVLNLVSTSSPTQTKTLENLSPNTNYSVRVRAASVWRGRTLWGIFSEDLSLLTNMTAPSAPPSHVQALALDPFSVLVTWQPVPQQHQHGPVTGYSLTYRLQNDPAVLGSRTVNGSQLNSPATGLSPWTCYSFIVAAKNPKGFGPESDPISIRTKPTAPSAPPSGLAVSALPGNVLRVDWQPVPAKYCNSEVAVYIVQYRLASDTVWTELSTIDNKTLNMSIRNLVPWSWYEIRIAAKTRQVASGQGPYSALVHIRTLEAAAGPVRAVSFNSSATVIFVSWKPPLEQNGVITAFRVDYHPIPLSGYDKEIIVVNKTEAELVHLFPGSVYNISISAINGAGIGRTIVLRVRTALRPLHPTAQQLEEIHTANFMEVDGDLTSASNETSSSSRHLPAIVAGTLTGAAVLAIILILVLCQWYRARKQARTKYLIQDNQTQDYGSGTAYSDLDNTGNIIITSAQRITEASPSQSSSSLFSSAHDYQQQGREEAPRQLSVSSWLMEQTQALPERAENTATYLPTEGAAAVSQWTNSAASSAGSEVYTVSGVDNLGFEDYKLLLPRLSPSAADQAVNSASAAAGQNEESASTLNRRKGRMRSESAAAIAVLRSAGSAALTTDDSQFLLSNEFSNVDTEVVFKLRTAL